MTEFTPLVFRAIISARSFSALEPTVPLSVTTCSWVSTLISLAFTVSSVAIFDFTALVIPASVCEHATVTASAPADNRIANLWYISPPDRLQEHHAYQDASSAIFPLCEFC